MCLPLYLTTTTKDAIRLIVAGIGKSLYLRLGLARSVIIEAASQLEMISWQNYHPPKEHALRGGCVVQEVRVSNAVLERLTNKTKMHLLNGLYARPAIGGKGAWHSSTARHLLSHAYWAGKVRVRFAGFVSSCVTRCA